MTLTLANDNKCLFDCRKGRFHRIKSLDLSAILEENPVALLCKKVINFKEPVHVGCVELVDIDAEATILGSSM